MKNKVFICSPKLIAFVEVLLIAYKDTKNYWYSHIGTNDIISYFSL